VRKKRLGGERYFLKEDQIKFEVYKACIRAGIDEKEMMSSISLA